MSDERRKWEDHEIEAALREFDAEDADLLEPPRSVWDGIQAAVHAPEQGPGAEITPMAQHRRTRRIILAVAAAAVLLAGVIVALTTLGGDEPDRVIATAELGHDPQNFDPLGAQAQGRANLVERGGGHTIEIADASLVPPEAGVDLEVWLIKPDDQGGIADLVSIGLIDPDDPGTLEVPSGYDPLVYNIVDISVEPRDGDASHSGRTILRGPLREA